MDNLTNLHFIVLSYCELSDLLHTRAEQRLVDSYCVRRPLQDYYAQSRHYTADILAAEISSRLEVQIHS